MSRMTGGFRAGAREHRASILVAGLSAAFGVLLLQGTNVLAALIAGDAVSEHGTVRVVLVIVAAVFLVIALYVAAIVTANTFATIVAGRARSIALLRLVGASASSLRRSVAREGLVVGALGAVIGAVIATALAFAGLTALVATGVIPGDADALYAVLIDPLLALPLLAVVVTTWLAS